MQNTNRPANPLEYPLAALRERPEAVRQSLLVLLFGVLTAIGAQVSIPFYPVPVTGQVFMVLVAGALLGGRLGAYSQLVYLAIGILGAPVFSGGKGTLLTLLGPTGGYVWAFPLAAWVAGTLAARFRTPAGVLGSLWAADLVILALGAAWLGAGAMLAAWPGVAQQPDLVAGMVFGLDHGFLPFVPVDLVKVVAAAALVAAYRRFR